MTLEEKRVALQTRLDVATENFQKARERLNKAKHEVRLAESADQDTHSAYNFANKRVELFKAFYDPKN